MTKLEFIRKLKEIGFKVSKESKRSTSYQIIVFDKDDSCVCIVSSNTYEFNTTYIKFSTIEEGLKTKLFNLIVEFSKTPLKDKKMYEIYEEKRFYLRLKNSECADSIYTEKDRRVYLNKDKEEIYISTLRETESIKTKFTEDEIRRYFPADFLNLFDRIEVEDD